MWTLLRDDERVALGRHGSLIVAVLRAPLDVAFFDDLDGRIGDADEAGPVSILLVRAGASPGSMSPEVRDRTRALLSTHTGRLTGFAYVNAGAGLKAKLLRGAMNAALLASGFSGKVFTDVDAALAWLSTLPGQPPELLRALPEVTREVRGLSA